jgi:hypothetical protein
MGPAIALLASGAATSSCNASPSKRSRSDSSTCGPRKAQGAAQPGEARTSAGNVSERADHSVTISFGRSVAPNAWASSVLGPAWPGMGQYQPPAFEMIENVSSVWEKIPRAARPGA